MRKLICIPCLPLIVVVLLGLAASAQAQETYSLPASAGNVATLTDIITFQNAAVCQRLLLTPTCTQAQACTAASVAGGSSCAASDARIANVRIWPLSQPGREEFVTFAIAAPRFVDLASSLVSLKETVRVTATAALNTTQKNAICTSMSLPAGCFP